MLRMPGQRPEVLKTPSGIPQVSTNKPRAPPLIARGALGWLPVSLGALRAPRTAMRDRNGYKILVLGRIAVQSAEAPVQFRKPVENQVRARHRNGTGRPPEP
jgi:hypothetical protein